MQVIGNSLQLSHFFSDVFPDIFPISLTECLTQSSVSEFLKTMVTYPSMWRHMYVFQQIRQVGGHAAAFVIGRRQSQFFPGYQQFLRKSYNFTAPGRFFFLCIGQWPPWHIWWSWGGSPVTGGWQKGSSVKTDRWLSLQGPQNHLLISRFQTTTPCTRAATATV